MAGDDRGEDALAPVIPLFVSAGERGASSSTADVVTGARDWGSAWDDEVTDVTGVRPAVADGRAAASRDDAEETLLRRLRTRQLSVREARGVLAERDVPAEAADAVIEAFRRRGYLDDARLAEQLVHSGLDRRGQGRRAIAQTLAKRGIARDVVEAAIAALPDDDAARALDYARGKARTLASLDRDTALRRLVGQLARRGYSGSVAMAAARAALDESTGQGPDGRGTGVRFR